MQWSCMSCAWLALEKSYDIEGASASGCNAMSWMCAKIYEYRKVYASQITEHLPLLLLSYYRTIILMGLCFKLVYFTKMAIVCACVRACMALAKIY